MLATQQLTEFLTVVADRPDEAAAQHAAVECALRALDADLAVLTVDGGVAAAAGLAGDEILAYALTAGYLVGRPATLRSGDVSYTLAVAPLGGSSSGLLMIGRASGDFTEQELCLLRGMARVLELSLQARQLVEAERRQSEENVGSPGTELEFAL